MSFDFKVVGGDISFSKGSPEIVRNKDKLIQDVLKMLFTSTGSNKSHPWYGTPLLSKVLGSSANLDLLDTEVKLAIQYGLNNMITLQKMQEQDNQFVSPQESLYKILDISAEVDPIDKRNLVVKISIASKSSEIISESFIVSA